MVSIKCYAAKEVFNNDDNNNKSHY